MNDCDPNERLKQLAFGALVAATLFFAYHASHKPNQYQQGERAAKALAAKTGHECWAEVNSEMPKGYEIICGAAK